MTGVRKNLQFLANKSLYLNNSNLKIGPILLSITNRNSYTCSGLQPN